MSESESTTTQLVEIERGRLIRPELFHTRDVSGVAVPVFALKDGQATPLWTTHLRWSDGRREAVVLDKDWIELGDGSRLWIHPKPADPAPMMFPTWSEQSRRQWRDGAAAPNPADLFKRICNDISRYMEFPDDQANGVIATLALWVMLTYCYPAWDAVPYIYIGGPKDSGKTRLKEVLARLVFRPLTSDNPSAPFIFRTLHAYGGVFLFDEAERLNQSTPDVQAINSMLLAGYKRSGRASRLEKDGDTYKPVSFEVYGPKALVCIASLPPVLASRCIPVMMFRAGQGSPKSRRRIDAVPQEAQRLRDDLYFLALEYGPAWIDLASRSDVCPQSIANRSYELWQPILALASGVESYGAEGLSALVEQYAAATIGDAHDETIPAADEVLLRIVANAVKAGIQAKLTPCDVLVQAQHREPAIFGVAGGSNGGWSATRVGCGLKRYGIKSSPGGCKRTYRDVTEAQLRLVQTNYGVELGIEPLTDTFDTFDTSVGSTLKGPDQINEQPVFHT